MELWLIITLVAAFLQNVRSLLQKRLTGVLSVNGAAYVRFLYAVPFAWVYGLVMWQGQPEGFNLAFASYVFAGAIAQIIGTACLLASFTVGNFAVGTAFSKTEAAQAALFGLVVLGDGLSFGVFAGIAVSLIGVVLLSGRLTWRELLAPNRSLWLGLASGAAFAVSAVAFRGASLSLDTGDFLQRSALTLMFSVTIQTFVMGAYLALREPGQIGKSLQSWRAAIWVGACGMVASAGWFSAMTLQSAAIVRAVGQVELLFTVLSSVLLLGERLRRRELLGIILVIAGILLLI